MNAEPENTDRESSSESKQLIERTEIPGTPFTAISTEGRHFATWGKYRIGEDKDTLAEVMEEYEEVSWTVMLRMLAVIVGSEVDYQLTERIKLSRQELEKVMNREIEEKTK